MKRNIIAILFLLALYASSALAATGTTGSISSEGFPSTSGLIQTSSYKSFSVAGEITVGSSGGTSYSSASGLPSIVTTQASADSSGPTIQNIKFDGSTIANGDYVSPTVVITATVTDTAGVLTTSSLVEIDSSTTAFASLTAPSSYTAATSALSVSNSFSDGTHTFRIHAKDANGNMTTSESISFKVTTADLKIEGTVLNYPNPFSPSTQTTKICYQLNKNSDTKIYIFNLINQLVKKFEISSGSEGGKAGYNQVTWDGSSDSAEVLPNDVYFARIVADGKVIGKCKVAIVK